MAKLKSATIKISALFHDQPWKQRAKERFTGNRFYDQRQRRHARSRRKRFFAFLIGLALCAAILFSAAFIVIHAEHEHTDGHCSICLQIGCCVDTLRVAGTAMFSAVFLTLAVTAWMRRTPGARLHILLANTPVSNKVKITH